MNKGFTTVGIFIVMVLFIFIAVNIDIKDLINSPTFISNLNYLKSLFWGFWEQIKDPIIYSYSLWLKYFFAPFKDTFLSGNWTGSMPGVGNIEFH